VAAAGEVVQHHHYSSSSAGREYYENLCLRVVNQSIGRSIRHVGDHAVILLLDQRFSQPHIRAKLPGWMADRVSLHPAWGSVAAGVGNFFRKKRVLAQAQANADAK
jgi:chromosome transmission fidelity protein 1